MIIDQRLPFFITTKERRNTGASFSKSSLVQFRAYVQNELNTLHSAFKQRLWYISTLNDTKKSMHIFYMLLDVLLGYACQLCYRETYKD